MSYKDIVPTQDRSILMETDEYKELKNELINKMLAKEIEFVCVNKELEELMVKMVKYMYNKKRRTKTVIKKKIEEIETLKIDKKRSRYCYIKDLEDKDLHVLECHKLRLKIPKERVFLEELQRMIKEVGGIKLDQCVYAYASLDIVGSTTYQGKTRKISTYKNPDMYKQILRQISIQLERFPEYEEDGKMPQANCITSTLTIGKWESIEKWWPNNNPAIKFRKYEDFTLFLASDRTKNCVRQCVEYLGEKYIEGKTIEEMLENKRIIKYLPIENMSNVTKLADLFSSADENIKTNDCKNIARLVKYNGHVGVITEIKQYRRRTNVQGQRRIANNRDDSLEVFFDIESFSEETDKRNKKQVPYLICWCLEEGEVKSSEGQNCIEEFVDEVIALSKEHKKVTLYAWYGSGYDYQHILPELKRRAVKDSYIIKNNSIIHGCLYFDHLNLKVTLKDPYLFLLTSLDKASKAFKVINKGTFPHMLVRSWEDLNKIYPNWIKVQQKMVETKCDNKLDIIVTKNTWFEYEKELNDKKIIEKAKEYCEIDVLAMREVWKKFKILIHKNLGIKISDYIFTLSQLSMCIMESTFDKNVKLMVPDVMEYDFIKDAVYGGRVIAKNGDYKEEIIYADVVSLYPSAMRLLKHGYGDAKKVTSINWCKMGIYKVKLVHKCDEEPTNYLNFVPRRTDGRLKWGWFKEHIGTFHTYDLLIARDEGFDIYCIGGTEYDHSGYIFDKFIDKLFKLKNDHSDCLCDEQPCPIRTIAKIALNGGGYGKFVQKPISKEIYIVKRDVVAAEFDKMGGDKIMLGNCLINKPIFYNLDGEEYDKMIIENEGSPVYATQLGVSILSGSRYRLWKLCKKYEGLEVIYSDTDSVFIRKDSIDYEKFKGSCNTELGLLDDTIENNEDGVIRRMVITGPKTYGYTYLNKKNEVEVKIYCKGVPKTMVKLEHLEAMHNNATITYQFDILRKKLIGVDTLQIDKNIRET